MDPDSLRLRQRYEMQIRRIGVLQITPDYDTLDYKASIVQSESGLGRLFPIWYCRP